MGKLVSYFSSWENISSFGMSFLKGALIGVPVALVVLGGFQLLNMMDLLHGSIQGMNNLPALLTFNTIFGGASVAVNDALDRYKKTPGLSAPLAEQSAVEPLKDVAKNQQVSITPSRSADIKRSVMLISDASHDGVVATDHTRQHTVH